ncbi:MAG: lytic murein transglycosylase B [Bacteroidota bacterium]
MSSTGMRFFSLIFLLFFSLNIYAQIDQDQVQTFVSSYASKNNLSEQEVLDILSSATFQPSIISKMDRPAEKKLYWDQYRKIFLTKERIDAGIEFMGKYQYVLQQVSKDTGVPQEIIASIIGVETYFGKIMGTYKVLDALYTLSFAYPRRAKYFQSELEELLNLAKKENLNLNDLKGSYAGAMGYCQFMPSSYRAYAVSFDQGNRDLVHSPEDAIASVANYLKMHRWKEGLPIASKANVSNTATIHDSNSPKVNNNVSYFVEKGYKPSNNWHPGAQVTLMKFESENQNEYWFGTENFYAITRYNHSPLYALAVFQLAEAIRDPNP